MRYEGGQYYIKSEEEMKQSISICELQALEKHAEDCGPMSCRD